ncbi:MAG: hypothetical protein ACE5G0_16405 [Rhodothermales bacterium]
MMASDHLICAPTTPLYLERVRYFPRQLITPEDLTQAQDYVRNKLRRHNRLLHGWGIVCGAGVRQGNACEVIIEQGYILGPYGDEIVIDREVTLDLCQEDPTCGPGVDPWCDGPTLPRLNRQTLYIAVRYAECLTRPVRVYANGCDETACEYTRIRDSYIIKALTALIQSDAAPPALRLSV